MIRRILICSFCLITTSTSLELSSENEEMVTTYGCYNWCIAKCLSVEKFTIDTCKDRCNDYNSAHLCSDSACWSKCKNLENSDGSKMLSAVAQLELHYSQNDSEVVVLKWQTVAKANLYLLVYRDSDDKIDKWKPIEELITSPQYLFTKPHFCLRYSFKVAAVSDSGIGHFSTVETIGKPEINISHSQVVVKLKSLVNTGNQVLARLYYDLGPAWKSTHIETTRTEMQTIASDVPNGESVKPKLFPNSTELELVFTLDHIKHKSKYIVAVEKLYSVCGTNLSYPTSYDASVALTLIIDCDTVVNSGCTNKKPPCTLHGQCLQVSEMNLTWIAPSVTVGNPSSCNSTSAVLYWNPPVESDRDGSICSPINIRVQIGLPQTSDFYRDMVHAKTILNELRLLGGQRSYTFPNLTLGEFYYFSVCAIYSTDPTLPEINWAVNSKLVGGGKDALDKCIQAATTEPESSETTMIVIITVLSAVALVSMGIAVVFVLRSRRSRQRLKKLTRMLTDLNERETNFS